MEQLTYETFSNEVLFKMQEKLGPQKHVVIHKVLKNNNIELDGIIVDDGEGGISPTFYMEQFYEGYNSGISIDDIVDFAYPYYEMAIDTAMIEQGFLRPFEEVKDRIAFKLVNAGSNARLLEEVPHFKYLDLAIVFFSVLENGDYGMGSILIRNEHLEFWNIEKNDLYDVAAENTRSMFGVEIKTIQDVIADMLVDDKLASDLGITMDMKSAIVDEIRHQTVKFPVYVLTNKCKHLGAVCMLYKELEVFADQLDTNLYIIPSSIHEVLLIPETEKINDSQLTDILRQVNRDELEEADFLSDRIYYYSRSAREIR